MDNILLNNRKFLESKKVFFGNPEKIKRLVSILNRDRVILISGIRFGGKTKFIKEMIEKTRIWEKAFYFNKELDTLWKIKSSTDLEKLVNRYSEKYQKPQILILQNISKIKGIKWYIAKIYEEKKYKLIIAENNLKIEGIEEIEIESVSVYDLLTSWKSDEIRSVDTNKKIKNILKHGSIEEVSLIQDIYMKEYLIEHIKTNIIAKDVIYAYSIKNSFLYNQTLSFLSSIDSYISLRELGRRLEWNGINISLITAIDYINFTLNSKLIQRVYRYDLKLGKEITSKAKYYFADTWIRNSISWVELNQDMLIENLIHNELKKNWYTLQWWIYGRFEFDFIATSSEHENKPDIYIHISKQSDRNEIQKEARKLWKAELEIKPSPVETNIDIFSQAPIGHWEDKVLPTLQNIKKILLVKDLDQINIRKLNIAWVEIVDLYEFIGKM